MANYEIQLEINGEKAYPKRKNRGCKISSVSTPTIAASASVQFSTSSYAKVVKYDTDNFYVPATGLITIPVGSGVTKIIARGRVTFAASSGGFLEMYLLKNQATNYEGANCAKVPTMNTDCPLTVISGVIDVVDGDTINAAFYNGSSGALVVGNSGLARITELEIIVIE